MALQLYARRSGRSSPLALCLGVFGLACAASPRPPGEAKPEPPSPSARLEDELPALSGRGAAEVERKGGRRVGDVLVHRFVGSYTKEALLLTERVIAHEPQAWVIDYELTQGEETERLRARLAERSERVLSVSRLLGDDETPVDVGELRKLLARTSFVPDRNAGVTAEERQTCLVGPSEFDCEVAHYRVFVGEREASLTVRKSAELERDLGGEIVALDGTVLYRAELVERVRGARPGAAASEGASASAR